MKKVVKELSPCLVCSGTERTSTHFGSTACMACASFFRRTVSFGIRFLCKASNDCVISPDVKFICRSCRYDNCVKAGMRRDLVQQKRDDSRVPKYVLESRKGGIREVVRGYTTTSYTSSAESSTSTSRVNSTSPQSTRSSTPTDAEFSTILNSTHDELLQYYVKQIQEAATHRQFDLPEDPLQQFLLSKRINDQLALEMCKTCPGTDLLDRSDLEVLFRYCSFASLWMDSAWITASQSQQIPREESSSPPTSDFHDLLHFIDHFQHLIGAELARLRLDVVEYAALKSFCIWKLGLLDSTLTLKIVAQEQYFGVTQALSKYYQCSRGMEAYEMATRLADVTLMLGSIFNVYQDMLKLYMSLGIAQSMDQVSNGSS